MQAFNELNIKALRLFVAVLDYGSFSEVARKEGVAPSSISRQMQLIEQALNQQLLYRHTRAVTATESGRLLATYARRVLEQLEEAEQALQEKKLEPAGLVRINAPVVFGRLHIAPIFLSSAKNTPSFALNWCKQIILSIRCKMHLTFCFVSVFCQTPICKAEC